MHIIANRSSLDNKKMCLSYWHCLTMSMRQRKKANKWANFVRLKIKADIGFAPIYTGHEPIMLLNYINPHKK
jgi:hypothetical protein